MRIDINLATQPYQDARRFWIRWGFGLAGLGIFTVLLIYITVMGFLGARTDRNLIKQREQQIAERDEEKARAERLLNLPENRSTRDRSQFLNDLFQRKSFSWTKVFEDLERVMPPRLHVVSIQPALAADNQLEIKLVVAGDSSERGLELVRRMEGSQRFQQTLIQQWRNQQSQAPGDNVQFDISALYVPEPGAKAESKRSTP
jgi:type IV pilus assembly protein PilN